MPEAMLGTWLCQWYLYIVRVVVGCGGRVNCCILLVTREGLCQSTQHEFAFCRKDSLLLLIISVTHSTCGVLCTVVGGVCAVWSTRAEICKYMGVAMDTEPYPVVAGLLIRKAATW